MKHTREIFAALLRISEAEKALEDGAFDVSCADRAEEVIKRGRLLVPASALSHFDRIRRSGYAGAAVIENGKCTSCGTVLPADEIEYLSKYGNVGVCPSCLSFIGMPPTETDRVPEDSNGANK